MMIAFHLTRFLTQVVHLANVRTTQRRFAPMLPHITGITGPLHRNTQLSAASEHKGHIDLLITDLVMPKMSGRELAQMLGSLRPDLKTIYMSGYTDDEGLRDGIHEQGATFLQKPFSLGTLARKVCETLGQCETVQ